ncbi:hypothetical protein CoNPh17_CDS0129 [Staphylococcus phage S-CoN_Ph17]|nr:hypothetical protein CoNPh17_CDS0129 [Staphylococcus phage S-CoN_Ph17]
MISSLYMSDIKNVMYFFFIKLSIVKFKSF